MSVEKDSCTTFNVINEYLAFWEAKFALTPHMCQKREKKSFVSVEGSDERFLFTTCLQIPIKGMHP